MISENGIYGLAGNELGTNERYLLSTRSSLASGVYVENRYIYMFYHISLHSEDPKIFQFEPITVEQISLM